MEKTTSSAMTSGRIFMSYRRQETAYATGWLFDRLAERYGRAQVFKDVDSLQPGDDFVAVIEAAVGSCSVLLALIGDQWLTVVDHTGRRRIDDPRDFVRIEIEAAMSRGVTVIPILVDGARMPQPTEVPDTLGPLVRRQALELSPARFDFDYSQLLTVLDRILDPAEIRDAPRPASEGSAEAQRDPARLAHRRRLGSMARTAAVPLSLVLVVTVAAVLVSLALRPNPATSSSPSERSTTASSSRAASQDSRSPSVAASAFTVQSQGRTRLTDPTQGVDLVSGKVVGLLQSQLAWNGLSGQLSVFDETTLGATVLDNAAFREVTPAQLASTSYERGAANPPLSAGELPAGKVLAVHVADRSYAKVTPVRYGPGDALELQWITYQVP